jgi:hypothetical protein
MIRESSVRRRRGANESTARKKHFGNIWGRGRTIGIGGRRPTKMPRLYFRLQVGSGTSIAWKGEAADGQITCLNVAWHRSFRMRNQVWMILPIKGMDVR